MKKFILISFIVFCFTGSNWLLAQSHMTSPRALESFVNRSGKYLMQLGEDAKVKGSPFLDSAFSKGNLKIKESWYKDVDLRYDAYDGVFQVQLDEGIYLISPDENGADTVIYNNETFIRKDVSPGNLKRVQYVSLLYHSGDQTLAKYYRIRLANAEQPKGYSDAKPAEYRRSPPEYLFFAGENIEVIKGTGSISDIFDADRKEVRDFLKKNKLDLKKDEDLVKVIQHFSSH